MFFLYPMRITAPLSRHLHIHHITPIFNGIRWHIFWSLCRIRIRHDCCEQWCYWQRRCSSFSSSLLRWWVYSPMVFALGHPLVCYFTHGLDGNGNSSLIWMWHGICGLAASLEILQRVVRSRWLHTRKFYGHALRSFRVGGSLEEIIRLFVAETLVRRFFTLWLTIWTCGVVVTMFAKSGLPRTTNIELAISVLRFGSDSVLLGNFPYSGLAQRWNACNSAGALWWGLGDSARLVVKVCGLSPSLRNDPACSGLL